jgi:hypothetical protein
MQSEWRQPWRRVSVVSGGLQLFEAFLHAMSRRWSDEVENRVFGFRQIDNSRFSSGAYPEPHALIFPSRWRERVGIGFKNVEAR